MTLDTEFFHPDEAMVTHHDEEYGTTWSVQCGNCHNLFQAVTPELHWVTVKCKHCRTLNAWATNLADLSDRTWRRYA